MHLQQGLALRRIAALAPVARQIRHGDAEPLRQHADGVGEAHLLLQLHELEDVAADAAPEAVEERLLTVHVERRRLLAVERAESFIGRAGFPERHVVLHHLHDVGLQTHIVDERLGEERHYSFNSTTVTPSPPWFGGAWWKLATCG